MSSYSKSLYSWRSETIIVQEQFIFLDRAGTVSKTDNNLKYLHRRKKKEKIM